MWLPAAVMCHGGGLIFVRLLTLQKRCASRGICSSLDTGLLSPVQGVIAFGTSVNVSTRDIAPYHVSSESGQGCPVLSTMACCCQGADLSIYTNHTLVSIAVYLARATHACSHVCYDAVAASARLNASQRLDFKGK